ncbi:MAG: hypothetical protein WKF91_18575 [Segetibacter sp.]
MATQYSILSVLIRPEIQEKISIGLLLFDLDQVYFSYSAKKLNVSKDLLSPSSFKMLKDILKNIESKIETDNSGASEKKAFKIFTKTVFDNTFSASYISYLSKYSNNIISFSNPKEIYLGINGENFKALYRKYIDNILEHKEVIHKIKPIEVIKTKFGEKIKEHYDINKEVTHDQVQNLISPVRIDFTGRNEIDVYAQTVDMEAGVGTVSNDINAFLQLKTTYIKNNVPVQDFVIAKEPSKELFPKQHDIWQQLRHSNLLNYLDLSESEEIVKYAEEHDVIPLSKADK